MVRDVRRAGPDSALSVCAAFAACEQAHGCQVRACRQHNMGQKFTTVCFP